MKRISLFIVFLFIAGYLLAAGSVQTLQNGMKVSPQNGAAKTIEIGVVNSRIIRVQASPESVLPDDSSLCVLPGLTTKTPFKVSFNKQFAQLSTDELTVKVSLLSGEILFIDKLGKVLLQEAKSG
jgi:alpha-D-xyloside xylohydrolase